MNPEQPVCTCISQPLPFTGLRIVKVFDPYCQIEPHKKQGSYTGQEPTYGRAGS